MTSTNQPHPSSSSDSGKALLWSKINASPGLLSGTRPFQNLRGVAQLSPFYHQTLSPPNTSPQNIIIKVFPIKKKKKANLSIDLASPSS